MTLKSTCYNQRMTLEWCRLNMPQSDFEKLQEAYDLRGIELHQLHERVSSLEDEIALLKEMLRLQKDRLFGKSSEASGSLNGPTNTSTGQAQSTPEPIGPQATTVSEHLRKVPPRGNRQLEGNQLPTFTVIHDLPKDQQMCACCGKPLHVIGQDRSKQLEIVPIQYCIIEHLRLKYGCRPCGSIVMAPKPKAPLPKAIAGPSLLTDVILSKYQYHLPLYRQSKIMQSRAITVSDKTLANWVMGTGDALSMVYEAMWVILKTRYLQVDETPVKVLETNKKGYVWAYFAPNLGKGLVVFDFSLTREGSNAFLRLKTFEGLLQTDGYSGYDALRKRENIVGFGCLSHVRRKFSEVVKISGDKQGIASEMIQRLKPLYALEQRMRDLGLDHRTRKRLRQKVACPILKGIYKWLRSIKNKVLPKSKLGKAIAYTLNQWKYLMAYLRHGMAEIDTNYVENKIRDIALGKKNWLFMGNEECGKIHALWYTLIISAIINEINPRVYIHYLLTKVHDLRRKKIDPITLLPDRIDIKELKNFAEAQVEFGRKILNGLNSS
jgi:transposase